MQIRKLRLTGFKSFVEPTELRIEPGLTGVVGPNGCGKSNLLEAIRWVMGEASPKSMRGGGMEDVIFAGTASRPARDFAEVSLHCDTQAAATMSDSDGGTELEVIRRIERGAGSAYRANGRDVRAKDIALIFADAATGAHSPALVSQGKIAGVIAAKPAERRAMLEEAAGIAGLHVRRKDAEQKLRATETNLTRLSEMTADMETRANALRRQARAAEKYRRLSEDIRIAEARLIFARWRDAAAAADDAKRDANAAEAAVVVAQKNQGDAELSQRAAAATSAAARAAAQTARDALAASTATLARVTGDEQAARQRLADLAAQQTRLADDRLREGDLARDAHAALVRLEADAKTLASEITAHTARRAAIEASDIAAQVALRDAEVMLAQARGRAASEAADRRIAQSAVDAAHATLRRIADEAVRLDTDMTALGPTAALQDAERTAHSAVAEHDRAIAASEAAMAAAETAREGAAADAQTADAALAEARAALAALDGEAATLARALTNSGQGGDRMIDQIRAAPGYEAALAAALGDDLDAGSSAAAPRGWLGIAPNINDPALPTGTRALADFVQAPQLLARRLTQIAVVETDAGQLLAVGQRLVTLTGAMRRWDGFRSSGDGATAAERLARQNRLDILAAQRPQVELGMAQLADRRTALTERAAAAAAAIGAARAQLAAADDARRAALRAADQSVAAIERHQAASSAFARRQAELAAAVHSAEGEARGHDAAIAALPDAALAQTALAATEQNADHARAAANDARSAIGDHDRALAALRERHAVTQSESKSWKDRAGEAARRVSDMDKRAATLAAEWTALCDVPERLAAARLDLEAEREQLVGVAHDGEQHERQAEAAMAEVDRTLNERREALATAREGRAGALARAENAELRRIEMGRLSGERFECPPPLLPEKAGFVADDVAAAQPESQRHDQLIADRERLGPVNLVAADELSELDTERARIDGEIEELTLAVNRLRGSIGNLNREGRIRLLAAFEAVNTHFQRLFMTLFDGGQAHLELVDSDDPLEAGLEIMAQPPGKRLGSLTLLSGGEQALTAVALIFALFLTNPAPICVLDEVDAPLDDANIERFCDLLDRMTQETRTRYLIVTHNAVTMARMHRLFGVTMVEQGVSRLVSVDLVAAEELLTAA